MTLDYLAPIKYVLGWLLPSVMISTAVGMFFTELTGTPIAIAIQGLWWFIDVNVGVSRIDGKYTLFQLSPRHNTLRNTQAFVDGWDTLVANRLLFSIFVFLLIIATMKRYETKRRGEINGFGRFKNSLQLFHIVKVNLQHNYLPLLILSLFVMIVTPILFGMRILDVIASAAPLELVISLIGIILFVPIFQPEQNHEIEDITVSLVFGTVTDAMFLGSIGLLTSAITNNPPVALMIPLLYYILI